MTVRLPPSCRTRGTATPTTRGKAPDLATGWAALADATTATATHGLHAGLLRVPMRPSGVEHVAGASPGAYRAPLTASPPPGRFAASLRTPLPRAPSGARTASTSGSEPKSRSICLILEITRRDESVTP